MANGLTANYGWPKPDVGGSGDAWGDVLNADLDAIDGIVAAINISARSLFYQEQLTVTAPNTLSHLSHSPNMGLMILFVDGRPFFPVGSSPAFSVSGVAVTWLSTDFGIASTSTVVAVYTWSGP